MCAHDGPIPKSRKIMGRSCYKRSESFFSCGWAILRAHKNSPKVHPEPLTLALSSSRRRFGLGLWLCGQVPTRLGSLLVWAHSSRKDCSCPSQFIFSTRSSHTGLSDIAGMSHKTIGATRGPTYTHTSKKTLMLCGRSHSLHMIHKDTLFPWPVHDWWSYIYIYCMYKFICIFVYRPIYLSIDLSVSTILKAIYIYMWYYILCWLAWWIDRLYTVPGLRNLRSVVVQVLEHGLLQFFRPRRWKRLYEILE